MTACLSAAWQPSLESDWACSSVPGGMLQRASVLYTPSNGQRQTWPCYFSRLSPGQLVRFACRCQCIMPLGHRILQATMHVLWAYV